jgi:hypothetical protein
MKKADKKLLSSKKILKYKKNRNSKKGLNKGWKKLKMKSN